MFRLRTLGGALIEGPDGPLTGAATQRRRLAVLALLAASGGGISRDRIVALLWPESDEERARHALSQLLYGLRRELGAEVVAGSATALRLDSSVLSSDIAEFDAALERGDHARAADLYTGPFLDGFFLTGCAEFERWVEEQRALMAQRAQRALETLAKKATDAGDASLAVHAWRRLAALSPWDSRLALGLMQALAAAGDPAGALRHARIHETMVRDELGGPPDAAIAGFVASLTKLVASPPPADAARASALGVEVPATAEASASTVPASSPAALEPERAAASSSAAAHAAPPSVRGQPAQHRVRQTLLAALALLAIAAVVTVGMQLQSAHYSGPRAWLLITDAENATGDAVFDHTLPLALAASLSQSTRINIMAPDRIQQALLRMRRTRADSVLNQALGREVAQREGVNLVLVPGIERANSGFEITARLLDPASGAVLHLSSVNASDRAGVIDALDRLGRKLRHDLGEPLLSLVTHTVALPQVTTRSLDALHNFADAGRAFDRNQLSEAKALYQRAIALDSSFASAWAGLGGLNFWINQQKDGDACFEHALAHLDALPERERVMIRARIEAWRGNREGAVVLARSWLLGHPDDLDALNFLGYNYMRMRQTADGASAFQQVLAIDSMDHTAWLNLAAIEKQQGNLENALRDYHRGFALMPALETANNNLNLEYGTTYVLLGQPDSAAAVFTRLLNSDQLSRARGDRSLAFLAIYQGHYTEATRYLTDAVLLARLNQAGVTEIRNRMLLSTVLDERGRRGEAREQLDSALAVGRRTDMEPTLLFWLGKALARSGNVKPAEALAGQLERRAHEGSAADLSALEGLRGELLVAHGEAQQAVSHLEIAMRADNTGFTMESLAHGLAAAGDLERAASLYDELARGESFGSEVVVYWRIAPYQLGIIEERRNDAELAARAYQRFLDGWRDAEPDLVSMVDARRRLTRLRLASPH